MSLNDLAELLIYPLEKIFIFLSSIQIAGVSLFSLMVAAFVIEIIFKFFIGQHSFAGGSHGSVFKNSRNSSGGNDGGDN